MLRELHDDDELARLGRARAADFDGLTRVQLRLDGDLLLEVADYALHVPRRRLGQVDDLERGLGPFVRAPVHAADGAARERAPGRREVQVAARDLEVLRLEFAPPAGGLDVRFARSMSRTSSSASP